ncbi:hypothetical protein [Nitratidesulfovibrio vulgaris]|uniref:Uncharacterized protein n=1 Tax=Nitratidesulfovibrio vulgaris (strain ATCC 29579 / DSM 644 / CCUG 34227 / NCIMB 8303 / VKM B-1760 / Hildenborough) TaxID=882 RepID=Q72A14_NITV2|nr:hypothetical protein [Nitratidesulfovibrio vulgaris]AAS96656.1 hypothetical protein DVU_2183 [Nitratidesulfovibrio vulgaris str. Hildenborough]ADP87177.1 hypothetical protein Deval_2032 [Nitratidesulfovibrio vulgaris RCH1]
MKKKSKYDIITRLKSFVTELNKNRHSDKMKKFIRILACTTAVSSIALFILTSNKDIKIALLSSLIGAGGSIGASIAIITQESKKERIETSRTTIITIVFLQHLFKDIEQAKNSVLGFKALLKEPGLNFEILNESMKRIDCAFKYHDMSTLTNIDYKAIAIYTKLISTSYSIKDAYCIANPLDINGKPAPNTQINLEQIIAPHLITQCHKWEESLTKIKQMTKEALDDFTSKATKLHDKITTEA